MEQIDLEVAGMTCGSCVIRVNKVLWGVPGVKDVEVDLVHGLAQVRTDDAAAVRPVLLKAMADAGYPSRERAEGAARTEPATSEPARPKSTGGCGGAPRAAGGCCCGH